MAQQTNVSLGPAGEGGGAGGARCRLSPVDDVATARLRSLRAEDAVYVVSTTACVVPDSYIAATARVASACPQLQHLASLHSRRVRRLVAGVGSSAPAGFIMDVAHPFVGCDVSGTRPDGVGATDVLASVFAITVSMFSHVRRQYMRRRSMSFGPGISHGCARAQARQPRWFASLADCLRGGLRPAG